MEFSTLRDTMAALSTADLLAQAVESVSLAVDELADGPDEVTILLELHRRGTRDIYEQAAAWCGDRRWLMRCLGADILGMLGIDAHFPFAAESEPTLTRLLDDRDPDVLCSVCTAFGNLGVGDTARIAKLAIHPSSKARQAVAWCLGQREDSVARDTLIGLSADTEAVVRQTATSGLAGMMAADCEEIRLALVARLEDTDPGIRAEAMMGLAVRGDERATSAIEAALDGTDPGAALVAMAADSLDVRRPAPAKPAPSPQA
jgi:hypothetical protein